mmetsp:Transcript_9477/g.27089  ORF Transcript_9477/g.27089 Transcript_9477/m.27089 type:complete len:300 (+) Transcript_9477:744-1643(+)
MLCEGEAAVIAPRIQLIQGLAQHRLALRLAVQLLDVLRRLGKILRMVKKVRESEILRGDGVGALSGHLEHVEELVPVLLLPAVAADILEVRDGTAVGVDLLGQDHGHRVRAGNLACHLGGVLPLGQKVLHPPHLVAHADPVALCQLVAVLEELAVAAPRHLGGLYVGGDVLKGLEVGEVHLKVLALLIHLLGLLHELRQRQGVVLHLGQHELRVALGRPLGLELVPAGRKAVHLALKVRDVALDLPLELALLLLQVCLMLLQLGLEGLPLVVELTHVYHAHRPAGHRRVGADSGCHLPD